MKRLGVVLLVLLAVPRPNLQAQIVSSFDLSAEGWTATSGLINWFGSGGNPNGWIRFQDATPASFVGIAPATFQGNLSAINGGTLSADFFGFPPNGDPGAFNPLFGRVTITNSGSSLSATAALVTSNPSVFWTSYSYPMTAAAWGLTASDWATLLSNVTSIEIDMDRFVAIDNEFTGMDNFKLAPVPEPGSLVLAALPACWLIRRLRKTVPRTPSES